ncbi:hypothetical protein KZ810_15000 [Sphingomonas sp. RHCKR47]|uniref:hypothetical protein n=1 Tax=Sphingomonas citricola TaxID=2862498 RepID=UPI001CA540D0|nr:hypothetical protein [Sphingomonas citricola]MBW6524806.1 hypothetical protein [Sphingomonas citricola]
MTLRFDRDAEEQFIDTKGIAAVARAAVDITQKRFSERYYRGKSRKLHVLWVNTRVFKAGAFMRPNGDHEVRISYGAAIEIYRDALLFPEACQRVLTRTEFDPIFNLLSYGNKRSDVLPAELRPEDAKLHIVQYMTTWLFLHEQAHLLQQHGELARSQGFSELLSHDGGLNDGKDAAQPANTGEASLRHAFEFAADFEALTLLLLRESREIDEPRLWCLAAGLMCMFHRFNEIARGSVEDLPSGTHPHPALRMRVAMNRIEQIFEMPDFIATSNWEGGSARARAIMDHAVYTADAYWHLRYIDLKERSTLIDYVTENLVVPASYQSAIFRTWSAVQMGIIRNHLGDGDAVTLFLRSPQAVGGRVDPLKVPPSPPGK